MTINITRRKYPVKDPNTSKYIKKNQVHFNLFMLYLIDSVISYWIPSVVRLSSHCSILYTQKNSDTMKQNPAEHNVFLSFVYILSQILALNRRIQSIVQSFTTQKIGGLTIESEI